MIKLRGISSWEIFEQVDLQFLWNFEVNLDQLVNIQENELMHSLLLLPEYHFQQIKLLWFLIRQNF